MVLKAQRDRESRGIDDQAIAPGCILTLRCKIITGLHKHLTDHEAGENGGKEVPAILRVAVGEWPSEEARGRAVRDTVEVEIIPSANSDIGTAVGIGNIEDLVSDIEIQRKKNDLLPGDIRRLAAVRLRIFEDVDALLQVKISRRAAN